MACGDNGCIVVVFYPSPSSNDSYRTQFALGSVGAVLVCMRGDCAPSDTLSLLMLKEVIMLLKRIAGLSSAVVAFAAAPALADSNFYVGAMAGQSNFHANQSDFAAATADAFAAQGFILTPYPFNLNTSSVDKTHFAFGGLIGYRLAPAFSIEAGYIDLGQVHGTSTASVIIPGRDFEIWNSDITVKAKGPTLAALGILPISPAWEIYGRAGVLFSRVTRKMVSGLDFKLTITEYPNVGGTQTVSDNSVDPLVGIGAAWRLTHRLALRAEYTRFINVGNKQTTGEMNIDFYNLGVTYSLRQW